MVSAQVLFAVMSLAARMGTPRGIPWQEVAFARFVVGAVTAWVAARLSGVSLEIVDRKALTMRALFGCCAAICIFYLLSKPEMPLGDGATLFATSPLFIAILMWRTEGERPRAAVIVAIVVGFVGVAAVAGPSFTLDPWLTGLGLLAAFFSSNAMIWLRRLGKGETSQAVVFHFSWIGAVVMGLLSLPVFVVPGLEASGWLLLTGISAGLAQMCMTRAYALDVAARVSAVGYTGLVFTRLFAWPMFGEVPSMLQWAGSGLVAAAGVLLLSGTSKAKL